MIEIDFDSSTFKASREAKILEKFLEKEQLSLFSRNELKLRLELRTQTLRIREQEEFSRGDKNWPFPYLVHYLHTHAFK